MSFLDGLKQAAAKLVSESEFGKQLVPIVTEAVQKIEGTSVEVLGNEPSYRLKISEPTYRHLPHAVRQWISVDQWHAFIYSLKDSIFMVDAGHLRLQPGFKAGVNEFVQQLIHGKKPAAVAAPAEPPALTGDKAEG